MGAAFGGEVPWQKRLSNSSLHLFSNQLVGPPFWIFLDLFGAFLLGAPRGFVGVSSWSGSWSFVSWRIGLHDEKPDQKL